MSIKKYLLSVPLVIALCFVCHFSQSSNNPAYEKFRTEIGKWRPVYMTRKNRMYFVNMKAVKFDGKSSAVEFVGFSYLDPDNWRFSYFKADCKTLRYRIRLALEMKNKEKRAYLDFPEEVADKRSVAYFAIALVCNSRFSGEYYDVTQEK